MTWPVALVIIALILAGSIIATELIHSSQKRYEIMIQLRKEKNNGNN
jgi:hypothetical protein